jgi:hypothetical protein
LLTLVAANFRKEFNNNFEEEVPSHNTCPGRVQLHVVAKSADHIHDQFPYHRVTAAALIEELSDLAGREPSRTL